MNFIAAFFCGGMVMEICDLSKVYKGKKVLDIKKLHIEEGQIYALVGENGAGKTTFFRILAGLALPTSGTIEFASRRSGECFYFASHDDTIGIISSLPAF